MGNEVLGGAYLSNHLRTGKSVLGEDCEMHQSARGDSPNSHRLRSEVGRTHAKLPYLPTVSFLFVARAIGTQTPFSRLRSPHTFPPEKKAVSERLINHSMRSVARVCGGNSPHQVCGSVKTVVSRRLVVAFKEESDRLQVTDRRRERIASTEVSPF